MMTLDQQQPINQPVVEIELPLPHLQIRLVRANQTWFVANRGGFKTTRGVSFYDIDCVYELPRSTGIICGPSYEHLLDNTLNPLFNALAEFGFEQDVHYVFGTRPPDEWEKPFITPRTKKYDHIVSWHNGTCQQLISMAKKGSANGISAQWGIFDEIKLMDERELMDVVFPVFRGNEKKLLPDKTEMQTHPLFGSKFFSTDKLEDPAAIKWILKKKELNDHRKIDIIITLQIHLSDLKEQYNSAGINLRQKLKTQINAVEVRLSKLRANLSFYVEADHTHTIQVMGQKWYDDKAAMMNEYELKVAIRNEDPDRPENGFYPDFNPPVHCYDVSDDYQTDLPLIMAPDYQHSVAPIPICQIGKLPGEIKESLNYIDEVYTMSSPREKPKDNGNGAPGGLSDAVRLFCERYHHHQCKRIYYVYDQTAIADRIDTKKYKEIVIDVLKEYKWTVIEVNTGKQPAHFKKYTDTKAWLKYEDKKQMQIRINRHRCPKLIISVTSAPARTVGNETKKDKRSEENDRLDQSETTHFSDCFDMINHAVLKLKRIQNYFLSKSPLGFGKR